MTSLEENIQSVRDQFYDIVEDKMFRFMEGRRIACPCLPSQFDMSNLSEDQVEFILLELKVTTFTCFKQHFHTEDLMWLIEEENIDICSLYYGKKISIF
jgi:hypothetical protein